jgi:hypothetical protein
VRQVLSTGLAIRLQLQTVPKKSILSVSCTGYIAFHKKKRRTLLWCLLISFMLLFIHYLKVLGVAHKVHSVQDTADRGPTKGQVSRSQQL